MPDSSNQRPGGRYDGLRDLQRRQRRRGGGRELPPGDARAGRVGAAGGPAGGGSGRAGAGSGPAGGGRAAERMARLRVPVRHRWPHRLLVGLNVVVAACLILGLAAFGYVDYRLGQVSRVAVPSLAPDRSGPFTVLVVGSDSRSLGSSGSKAFGSASQVSGQRSDTILLVRVVPATGQLAILSIPRDLWVHIDGIGYSKINGAFNTGPTLLVSTIRHDLGIPINHFVGVNFDSFRAITDAVGGVKVYFPAPTRDLYSLLSVSHPGCVNLTGDQALAFARSRHYEWYQNGRWNVQGLSDLARIQRQQLFVKKMIRKVESRLTDPVALNRIVAAVAANLTVDKGFGATRMISLAEDLRRSSAAGIPNETLPVNNYYVDGQDALSLQQPQASRMIDAFDHLGTAARHRSAAAKPAPHAEVAVQVANGSGVTGQAAAAARTLAAHGYRATFTSKSPGYGFSGNEIEYAPGSLAAARTLASRLAGGATLVESSTLSSAPYDLELITGADYAGMASHARRAAPPGATTTTTYLLPGPQPTASELAKC